MKKSIAIILGSLTLALSGAGLATRLLGETSPSVNAYSTSATIDLTTATNVSSASAENAYAGLSEKQKAMFANNAGYADAHARYTAWSRAYVESGSSIIAKDTLKDGGGSAIVSVFALSLLGLRPILGFKSKKKA